MSNTRLSPFALVLLLATIAVAAAFSYFVVAQRYWLDDSFISYRYAWHLAAAGETTCSISSWWH